MAGDSRDMTVWLEATKPPAANALVSRNRRREKSELIAKYSSILEKERR
jgi:hypothetical protein